MGNFSFNFRVTLTRYLSLLIAVLFLLTVTQGHASIYYKTGKKTYVLVTHVMVKKGVQINSLVFFLKPEQIISPTPLWSDYKIAINSKKPNNLQYQPIRTKTLGLINAQMNI